jgi:hypothetical protein
MHNNLLPCTGNPSERLSKKKTSGKAEEGERETPKKRSPTCLLVGHDSASGDQEMMKKQAAKQHTGG